MPQLDPQSGEESVERGVSSDNRGQAVSTKVSIKDEFRGHCLCYSTEMTINVLSVTPGISAAYVLPPCVGLGAESLSAS